MKEQMRIGFDAKRAFRNFTGLGNYSRAAISILSEYYPDNNYFLYTTFYKKHPLLAFSKRPNITVRGPEGFLKRIPSLWRSYGIVSDIHFDKVELFHGLTGELPVGLSPKVKKVVTIHDLIFLRYPEYYKSFDRWIYTRKCKSACKRADLIIAISEQTKQDIIHFFGTDEKKIRLVYQGCNEQFYDKCSKIEKKNVKRLYKLPDNFVLSVGTIESRKNMLGLVKAFQYLPEDIHLVVIGRATEYAKQVKEEVQKLGLTERIWFLHRVAFSHLPAIYQQAKLFCLPSLFEGFGIPILEALNSGLPVVTSKISSLPEAGGPDSIYIDPLDDKAIAEAIHRAATDDALRERMITKGLKYALNFREKNIAKNLWNTYKEVMS